jgi:presenilin-like A22 family membrane protease
VKPGGKFLILGAGDIVFPLILTVSLIPQGISDSLIVASFSLLGLLVGFLIFISQPPTGPGGGRQPMPALPPIALFSIIGYLITRII